MKTLKYIGMALMLIALSTGFTSCSSDDDPGPVQPPTSKLWKAYSPGTEKWGYINENGDFVIPAQYDRAHNFYCGRARVETGGKEYFIDQNGKIINSTGFDDAEDFYNNYAVVEKDDVEGLINTNGDYVIQPIYASLGEVASNGLLAFRIQSNGKKGFINTNNDRKVEPEYNEVETFNNGVACVRSGSKWGAINAQGKWVIQPTYDYLRPVTGKDMVIFSESSSGSGSSMYGVMDHNGNIKVQALYISISNDWTGHGILKAENTSGKVGFIDVNGNVVVPFNYDDAEPFEAGWEHTAVYTETDSYSGSRDHTSIINRSGNIVFTLAEDEEFVEAYNGLILTYKYENGKETYTYRNASNKVVYTWTK